MDEIKSMLREVLELEGLLMVADSRGDETPDAVFTLIREKVEQLRAVCDCLPEALPEDSEDEELPDEPLDDVPVDDVPVEEPAEEEPVEEESEVEPEIEVEIEIEEESEVDPEIEEDPEIDVVIEPEAEPETVEDELVEIDVEPEFEPEPESEEEPETEPESEEEPEPEPEAEPDIEEEVEEEISDEPAPEETITLDEAFIRNKAKDLKSAFSLNDTFRFRRELFGNSAADMNDAIDLVNAMNSYDEAEDYFINDLGWDAESDEVREFMEIIRNHFIAQ